MSHKKKKHVQNVSTCWHFLKGSCIFGDDKCWFIHEDQSKESGETDKKSMKCNICDEIHNTKKEFMVHLKKSMKQIFNYVICTKMEPALTMKIIGFHLKIKIS